jgi:hypothetical protein
MSYSRQLSENDIEIICIMQDDAMTVLAKTTGKLEKLITASSHAAVFKPVLVLSRDFPSCDMMNVDTTWTIVNGE